MMVREFQSALLFLLSLFISLLRNLAEAVVQVDVDGLHVAYIVMVDLVDSQAALEASEVEAVHRVASAALVAAAPQVAAQEESFDSLLKIVACHPGKLLF